MAEPLTRSRIVAAALAVAEDEGLPGLSMRKVARRLDVEAMALYRHVRNKDHLLDALYDHLVGQVEGPDPTGSWREEVALVATRFRTVLFAHPSCVPLLATRPATTPSGLRLLEEGVALLRHAAFTPDDAMHAFQTVFVFVIGHAVFHTAGGQLPDDAFAREEFDRGLDWLVRGLAIDR